MILKDKGIKTLKTFTKRLKMICNKLACDDSNCTIVISLIEDSIFPNILNIF